MPTQQPCAEHCRRPLPSVEELGPGWSLASEGRVANVDLDDLRAWSRRSCKPRSAGGRPRAPRMRPSSSVPKEGGGTDPPGEPEPPPRSFASCDPREVARHLLDELIERGHLRLDDGRLIGGGCAEIDRSFLSRLIQGWAGSPCKTRRAGLHVQVSTVGRAISLVRRAVAEGRAPPVKHERRGGGRGVRYVTRRCWKEEERVR